MKHFLATRFNLPAEDWKVSRNGQKVLTDSWLKHRFEIFEKYYLEFFKAFSDSLFTIFKRNSLCGLYPLSWSQRV